MERPERPAPTAGAPVQRRANVVTRKAPPKASKRAATRRPARASRSGTRRAVAPRVRWVRPSGGPLTSPYGMRWGRLHKGIDLGAAYGSPIYAASDGVVTYAGAYGGYGRLVTIRHAGGYTTAYGHMSRMVVRSGQRVSAGQTIAYVGSAGHSTGPHLHFEVRSGGGFINPIPFLRSRGVYL
jgi:murein DD-endopeptidase MepM/ murein hydrolase activator NlpD